MGPPGPLEWLHIGSLDSRPQSDLTATHPPPRGPQALLSQLGGASRCIQIQPHRVLVGRLRPGGKSWGEAPPGRLRTLFLSWFMLFLHLHIGRHPVPFLLPLPAQKQTISDSVFSDTAPRR